MPKISLGKGARLAVLAAILVALLAGVYGATCLMFGGHKDTLSPAREIDSIISANLAIQELYSLELRKNYVTKQSGERVWEQIEVIAEVDKTQSLANLSESLEAKLDRPAFNIVEEARDSDPAFVEKYISIYCDDLLVYQLLLRQNRATPAAAKAIPEEVPPGPGRPKVALIVDDVGYDLERALKLLNLRRPMSISIFPKLKYTRHIAEVAHDLGYEIMMHLPMEPDEKLRRNPGFITTDMTEEEMCWVLDRNLQSIPFVIGVNNHQGSMMTRDAEAMARVMKYLAKKDMFFIDSRTTSESVAYRVAKEHGLRAAENDLFLDNEKDVEYIKERIELLIEEAKQKGRAIGICHVHPATTQALHEMFPVMEEQGIELVFASDLAE